MKHIFHDPLKQHQNPHPSTIPCPGRISFRAIKEKRDYLRPEETVHGSLLVLLETHTRDERKGRCGLQLPLCWQFKRTACPTSTNILANAPFVQIDGWVMWNWKLLLQSRFSPNSYPGHLWTLNAGVKTYRNPYFWIQSISWFCFKIIKFMNTQTFMVGIYLELYTWHY